MSEQRYHLLKEDHTVASGWLPVKKGITLAAAEAIAKQRESLSPWRFNNKNPDRVYHLIEPVGM